MDQWLEKWVITYNILLNGLYWGYNPWILSIFSQLPSRDIQAALCCRLLSLAGLLVGLGGSGGSTWKPEDLREPKRQILRSTMFFFILVV